MASPDGRNLINLLECPSCHQTMALPIFLCEAGHNVCYRCRGQRTNCPSCYNTITQTRNHLAERFAEKLPYSCTNQNLGCEEKFLLRDLPSHEAACPFRLYYCVPCRPRCRWRGRRFQVLEHMKDEHKELVWVKAYNSLVYENFDHKTDYTCTHILSSYREIFWCHSKRDAKQGKLFELVQYVGQKEKAAKFEYEFEFYAKGNSRRAIFRNTVHSEDDDVEKIYESGDCLILDLSVLKYFVTEKKQLFYNFTVERVWYN
ncbi:E3 ubiquitin-protein ligase sina-like isoform X2 [Zootermopsis nevadensis]|uniref:E3 ubiquitin-protein ligase n=2 Tax=Zootermopsis nevadensis TaxID=136037 RepID=A0A067RKJ6_ZOONE|nr:E3 ubiquitin-protein ligase sina-like isoform X2 [Zootermopsis nevadensis]XP_021932788.1 E3 ubiquitin-protein ligase sina-like isoform X2 [Zootermopsis nevadensis]XP_021932796.1 E3 ubiquitin-protein ligase sina-like isoform X2 [Zootermopsis nevadensis]XP_021932805.1 E3 ubiquitin-protein ligase sina-like isoform X2 [Zootermopsis nevadensis]XP_021932814.1 E3 ubiquitin-protein ligase sina-like isoform X2 [Zootermopsis nevadensis]XP_021932823.1 E3 ubiquitin-protein ligase sina-like isoform X2 [